VTKFRDPTTLCLLDVSYDCSWNHFAIYIIAALQIDGVAPLDWRRANVCPVNKKGSKAPFADNHRPISLTCSQLCKVFEFIIREEIVNHFKKVQLIFETQRGFRVGRSCLSNLLTFLEKASKAIDDELCLDVIYLDSAKAIDKVPRKKLTYKLLSHGTEADVLRWLTNWLDCREPRVCINGSSSGCEKVISGVPHRDVVSVETSRSTEK